MSANLVLKPTQEQVIPLYPIAITVNDFDYQATCADLDIGF
jgi:hypothetical protein